MGCNKFTEKGKEASDQCNEFEKRCKVLSEILICDDHVICYMIYTTG